MTFYAVRHIPTGKYLVPGETYGMSGHTGAEPSRIHPPRLFENELSANLCLARYCEGRWHRDFEGEITCHKEPENPYRIKSDYELIEVELP